MTRIVLHCSISLDGFATGPAGDLTRLHDWMFSLDEGSGTSVASALTREFHASKAIIFGRRTWDSGQEPWGEDDVFSAPVFVLTHELLQPVERNGTVFTFVSNLHEAVRRASAVTGGGDVALMGSPAVAQQAVAAGLVDEFLLHLVPVLLGSGTPCFGTFDGAPVELEPAGADESPAVTGLRYRVRGAAQAHDTFVPAQPRINCIC
jgi:dihydrofolate reductase